MANPEVLSWVWVGASERPTLDLLEIEQVNFYTTDGAPMSASARKSKCLGWSLPPFRRSPSVLRAETMHNSSPCTMPHSGTAEYPTSRVALAGRTVGEAYSVVVDRTPDGRKEC